MGTGLSALRPPHPPAHPQGRRRPGVRPGRRDHPGRLPAAGDRALPGRAADGARRAGSERAVDDLLLYPGDVLLDGSRGRPSPVAAEQAEVRRRHRRRRLRRQGGHCDRDDLRAPRPEGAAAGQVALDARGGVPLLFDAVTNDGWLLGRQMLTLHDAGAYTRFSSYGLTKHSFHHTGAYTIPNLRFNGYVVFTNRVPTTAMRGFGVTSVSYAVEAHIARIADVLGMSPWELRL